MICQPLKRLETLESVRSAGKNHLLAAVGTFCGLRWILCINSCNIIQLSAMAHAIECKRGKILLYIHAYDPNEAVLTSSSSNISGC